LLLGWDGLADNSIIRNTTFAPRQTRAWNVAELCDDGVPSAGSHRLYRCHIPPVAENWRLSSAPRRYRTEGAATVGDAKEFNLWSAWKSYRVGGCWKEG